MTGHNFGQFVTPSPSIVSLFISVVVTKSSTLSHLLDQYGQPIAEKIFFGNVLFIRKSKLNMFLKLHHNIYNFCKVRSNYQCKTKFLINNNNQLISNYFTTTTTKKQFETK
jgi:hypothetical protein